MVARLRSYPLLCFRVKGKARVQDTPCVQVVLYMRLLAASIMQEKALSLAKDDYVRP